jgi:hypothetical protein
MGLGCPQCGSLTNAHEPGCDWKARHPTVGHIIVYEYAGFQYSIKHMYGGTPEVTPLDGQHANASHEKHIRAARETYLDDWSQGRISDGSITPATTQ